MGPLNYLITLFRRQHRWCLQEVQQVSVQPAAAEVQPTAPAELQHLLVLLPVPEVPREVLQEQVLV
jgi:hypothetical protein